MPFFLAVLSIFKNYWKVLVPVIGGATLITFAYWKGLNKCATKYNIKVLEEVKSRYEKEISELDKIYKEKERINNSITQSPIEDKRDSCLLSNDPFETNCIK